MRKWWLYLCLIILVGIGVLGYGKYSKTDKTMKMDENVFQSVEEAYDLIRKESVHETPEKKLIEGAINGMAGALKDPYSTYYTKEEAKLHKEQLSDERVGIGAEITESQGRFLIVSPMKDSPAEKAGLKPYDEIVQVDKERTDGKSLPELIALIRGKEGTTVKMTVYRPSEDRHVELKITRAAITQKSVSSKVLVSEGKNIGYISINVFGEKTAEEWYKNTNELAKQNITSLIIDVRSNPGGYLKSVAQIISSLIKPNTPFAYMEDSVGHQEPLQLGEKDLAYKYDGQLKKWPTVLLQDEGSASASEVLSGALKELNRAAVIGVKSFGKGTVQATWPLSNGGELKLSTHKWLTPKREWIHGKGIKPTIEVEQNALYHISLPPISGRYKEGDFSEDIQAVQQVLKAQGYSINREDGYFDRTTADAVSEYSKKHNLDGHKEMDETFLFTLRQDVVKYRENLENDLQLQMAVGYLIQRMGN